MYGTVINDILFEAFQSTFAQPILQDVHNVTTFLKCEEPVPTLIWLCGRVDITECLILQLCAALFELAGSHRLITTSLLWLFGRPISSRCGLWLWLCVYLTSSVPIVQFVLALHYFISLSINASYVGDGNYARCSLIQLPILHFDILFHTAETCRIKEIGGLVVA